MKKFLEGCQKLTDGRYRIRENINIVPIKSKTNETLLIEGKEKNFNSKYTFLIWNNQVNANGRNYERVIDRVIQDGRTTITLTNHPEDEVDMGKANGVAKNPRKLENGWMCVDWFPADCEDGRRFASIFDLGGPISVSSSVLGNLDDEGYVMNDDCFELERYFDIVDSPSNRIVHFNDKVEIRNDDSTREDITNECNLNENITISKETSIVKEHKDNAIEEKGEKNMSDKLVETSMKMNIQSLIKDADKIENLYEKKDALMSAHSYADELSDKTLADEIQSKIDSIDSELKVLSEKGMKTDELSENVKSLTESKENLEKEITELKEEKNKIEKQLHTISTLYEEKQYKCGETELLKNRRLAKEVCTLKLKIKKQENELKESKNQIRNLKSKLMESKAFANTKVDVEEFVSLKESYDDLMNKNNILNEKVREMRIKSLKESKKQPSRFEMAQKKILEKNSLKEEVKNNIEVHQIDEDSIMEKMLNK